MFNLKNELNIFYIDTISKSIRVLDNEEWNLSLQSVLRVCQNRVKFQIYSLGEFPSTTVVSLEYICRFLLENIRVLYAM
jgi:hypothetical protein